ncbi:hypothetical protein [Prevotella sp.]|uniref:hypothetical protein n=1 Tax=uncultured Prevotella sp. TaxID=159272 RepID=UPI0025EC6800|nr:hypothetical protein [uncultured Prevotella sp.]
MKKKYIKPQSIVIDIIIEPFLAGSSNSYGINSEGNEGNFICDESEDEYEESKNPWEDAV